jgi:hypothetical protein
MNDTHCCATSRAKCFTRPRSGRRGKPYGLRARHIVCYWTTVGIGRKSPIDGANRRRFGLWRRLQLRHQSQTPRAQAQQRKLARALTIRHLVSGKRRVYRHNWQFADDDKRTANCSESTQCEEGHRAAISIRTKPERFVMDWPGPLLPILKAQIETSARQIAEDSVDPARLALARIASEAGLELSQVRQVRKAK